MQATLLPHKWRICYSHGPVPVLLLVCLASIFSLGLFRLTAAAATPDWSAYYPLAVGNTWIYSVHVAGRQKSGTIRWQVTQAFVEDEKTVYLISPRPTEVDDGYMELSPGIRGVEDVRQGIFLLKFPITAGEQWSHQRQSVRKNHKVSHIFKVQSAGKPCAAGKFTFSDCVVVEDSDEELDLKTVTTYARDVGPISYKYWKHDGTPSVDKFLESNELLSRELIPPK